MRFSLQAQVTRNQHLSKDLFLLELQAGEIAGSAQPGQFVNLSFDKNDPFLPRPFSVFQATENKLVFLIKKRGKATELLWQLEPGQSLLASGPFGKPLPKLEDPVLVAGGVGLAPLAFYARKHGGQLLLGLAEPVPELMKEIEDINVSAVHEPETVVQLLLQQKVEPGRTHIACGPRPMLLAVSEVVQQEDLVLVLEGMMACGVGICVGCAVPSRKGGYLRVCTQGPWFKATEIELQAMSES